jgi:hypothetical protein
MTRIIVRGLIVALMAIVAASCQTARPPAPTGEGVTAFPSAAYDRAAARGTPVYDLNPDQSKLRAYVYRAGPMARQGHNHIIVARDWQGALALETGRPGEARLDLRIPVAALEVDPPGVRQSLGGAFAERLDQSVREGTRGNMLAAERLMADRYPVIGVSLAGVTGELPRPILTLRVRARDETTEVRVPVAVKRNGERIRAQGRLILSHRELGMTPASAAGGALRVAEPITVEFDLVGKRRDAD